MVRDASRGGVPFRLAQATSTSSPLVLDLDVGKHTRETKSSVRNHKIITESTTRANRSKHKHGNLTRGSNPLQLPLAPLQAPPHAHKLALAPPPLALEDRRVQLLRDLDASLLVFLRRSSPFSGARRIGKDEKQGQSVLEFGEMCWGRKSERGEGLGGEEKGRRERRRARVGGAGRGEQELVEVKEV